MIDKPNKALYWFTKDLSVQDNKILHAAHHSAFLSCVYIVDPIWFQDRPWQRPSMCAIRWQFLLESIQCLKQNLLLYGQELIVLYGSAPDLISELAKKHGFDRLFVSRLSGYFEQQAIRKIKQIAPTLSIKELEQYTLFDQKDLPFELSGLPSSYSKFRKRVEQIPLSKPLPAPTSLPAMPAIDRIAAEEAPPWLPMKQSKHRFKGGENAALRHLDAYFSSNAPGEYKILRNELSGWTSSSKLSPWLNSGCLSPRQITSAIATYENQKGANESTHWLYLELLWREYFQWWHFANGNRLFSFQGSRKSPPLTSFYPERFRKWCEGATPYRLVNACMKELKETGYPSNRGRQIAASCLVNELSIDWRYGAAWFEHCLIDYEVATNWGNWQYIAGVGVDPQGGRHFNLDKQAQLYDPDGLYQKRWNALAKPELDSRDPADWPIMPV